MKRPTKSWIFILSALTLLTVLALPVNAEAGDHRKSRVSAYLSLVLNLAGNRYDRNRCDDNYGRYDRYDRYSRDSRYDRDYDRYNRYDRYGRNDDYRNDDYRYDDYRSDRYDDCGRSSRRSRRVYHDSYRRGSAEIIIVGRIPL